MGRKRISGRENAGTADFQQVHERFRPRVLRYLTRLVGEGEAEDVTQAVMLKVSEALGGFRGDSSLSTWIYRIATNSALDRLRRRTGQPPRGAEPEFDGGDVPPEEHAASAEIAAVRAEMNACIRDFIERLPESYRIVMALRELEGFRNGEIAAILGLSVDTVKIRLHRARERLRRDLELGCRFDRDAGDGLTCDRKPDRAIGFHRRR